MKNASTPRRAPAWHRTTRPATVALVIVAIAGCSSTPTHPDDHFEMAAHEWAAGTQWESDIEAIFANPSSRSSAIEYAKTLCEVAREHEWNTTQAADLAPPEQIDFMVLVGLAKAAETAYCPDTSTADDSK